MSGEKRPAAPLEPEVARAVFVGGTLLILGLALWPILGDWRWAVGGAAGGLVALLYAAAVNASRSNPNR